MPSSKKPVVVLDVANLKSVKNFTSLFPSIAKHLSGGRIKTAAGGAMFRKELRAASTFIPLFLELSKAGKLISICDDLANIEVNNFNSLLTKEFGKEPYDCDDPHLFTLLKLSNSKTIISFDKRISKCRRCLRRSSINNDNFANPKRVESDAIYLKLFNTKNL